MQKKKYLCSVNQIKLWFYNKNNIKKNIKTDSLLFFLQKLPPPTVKWMRKC